MGRGGGGICDSCLILLIRDRFCVLSELVRLLDSVFELSTGFRDCGGVVVGCVCFRAADDSPDS